MPFVTPVCDPSGEIPKTDTDVPSSTNQIEQQGMHSHPVADNSEVHSSSLPSSSVGTPASNGNVKENHMPKRVPKRSPMVRRGTFGTRPSIQTPPQRVAIISTPPGRVPIRNPKGSEVKCKAGEGKVEKKKKESEPKREVEKTSEGQIKFKISPVTGISPDETASPSPPMPFVTPVCDPSGEIPKTDTDVPSSTNQIEQQGMHSHPVADNSEVHSSSLPSSSVGTPASNGNVKENHMPKRVPKRSPMVRRGTFGTRPSIQTPPQRVAIISTPPGRVPIRNPKGSEVKCKAGEEKVGKKKKESEPKREVEKTSEGQINFKISLVTGKTLTFAEAVSTRTSSIPVKNSHRNPFATLSTNSSTLGRSSLPLGDPKTIEDIVKIGYSNKKTPQHGKVKRVSKENTLRKPHHHPYHRSKSQGSNLIARENMRNSEYLHKYGLPSMLDQMPSVKQSRQTPAYMSMTKSAADKRKHAPERRTHIIKQKENMPGVGKPQRTLVKSNTTSTLPNTMSGSWRW